MNTFSLRVVCAWIACATIAEAAFPPVRMQLVCSDQIDSPVAMVSAGDGSGRMFIVDQRGKIRIFRNGMLQPGVFLDLGAKLVAERAGFDERGLLGLAFHPGYANAASSGFRRFYVFYIAPSPLAPGTQADPVDSRTVIAEYQVSAANPDMADPASERILLTFDKPQFNHAGGGMDFGPDGLLYFSVGDGGSSQDNFAGHTGGSTSRPPAAKGNAQDLTRMLGKLHRIDPLGTNGPGGQYGIPADNPYAASPNGERPEIYAYGLRNLWRFSFDSRPGGTNRLFGADVGQGEVEEVNLITKGGNYGWRNKEGTFTPGFSASAPPMVDPDIPPIVQYAHPGIVKGSPALPQLGISVTGGYVYRGSALPGLVGKYVFGDFSQSFGTPSGILLGAEETSPGVWALAKLDVLGGNPFGSFLQAFGQDEAGELYVLTRQTLPVSAPDPATGRPSGRIYKIVPVPATTPLSLPPLKDNTMFQENENSNGRGEWLFAGAVDDANFGSLRRALLSFDVAPIPAGATVASATVTLQMDKTIAPDYAFSLHRMSADWGEGFSDADGQEGTGIAPAANDATWVRPFFGQAPLWSSAGGDFIAAPSATTLVSGTGAYQWSAPQLAYDVHRWKTNAGTNFGWMLRADVESRVPTATGTNGQNTVTVSSTDGLVDGMRVKGFGIGANATIAAGGINRTTNVVTLTVPHNANVNGAIFFAVPSAKRFVSMQGLVANDRPKLNITYVPAPVLTFRQQWEAQHFFVGEFIEDSNDTEKDGLVDGIEYAWGFSPKSSNSVSEGLTVDASGLANGNPYRITFRRDPRATDLTYILQGSSDLVDWQPLAQSVGGATATGAGVISDTEIPGQAPFRAVLVRDLTPVGDPRFFRLKTTR